MKINNTTKLLGILVVLVLVYLAINFTGQKDRSKSYRDVLVEIDTAKVTQIEIIAPDETTTVKKSGKNSWNVETSVGQKPATSSSVKNLFNTLMDIKPSRLVARGESKWNDYSVDTTGTRVKIIEGKKTTLDLVVGRFGVEGQRRYLTHVRLFEDKDVYAANDFMGISMASSSDDFRNGDLLRLRKDSLTSIAFNYDQSAFTLLKNADIWTSTAFQVDSAAVAKYINGLGFVTSKKFATEESSDISPIASVTYSFSNADDITIKAFRSENDNWILKSSINPDETFIDGNAEKKIFVTDQELIGSES